MILHAAGGSIVMLAIFHMLCCGLPTVAPVKALSFITQRMGHLVESGVEDFLERVLVEDDPAFIGSDLDPKVGHVT